MVSPADPTAIFQTATAQFSQGGGQISGRMKRDVELAAGRAPLAEEPFFFAAVAALQSGDRAGAVRLLEEVRGRNPRMRLGRLLLVEQYLRMGRVEDAASEIAVLRRLVREVSGLLIDQLALLALDPQTRRSLRLALRADPLIDEVLANLVLRGADPSLILGLAAPRMRAYPPSNPPPWARALIESLVEARRYRDALALWQRFNRMPPARAGAFNPGFDNPAALPPFNWRLSTNVGGVAERMADGALEVVHFGRQDTELAELLLLLEPGRYRLQFSAESASRADGTRLFWRISCAGRPATLVNLPFGRLTPTPQVRRAEFEVTRGDCPAQVIKLVAESSEFPTRREAIVRMFEIVRAGAGQ